MAQAKAKIGTSPRRREDPALLSGHGRFADDVSLTDQLHVSFVRSQIPSGRINGMDIEDAVATSGVIAVHSCADVAGLGSLSVNPVLPIRRLPDFPILAEDKVLAIGQPIAAVLATSPAAAQDAAELVYPDIEETEFEATVIAEQTWHSGDFQTAFEQATTVVECEITHPRLAPSPMEPRSIAVAYDAISDRVTVWHSTQTPHRSRSELAEILGVDADRIRVIAQDVGGAFGMKASLYPEEVFAVWAAFQHKRSIKWTATRSEEFLSATHGRGVCSRGRLAIDANGRFLALSAEITAPLGAWLPNSGLITAWNAARVLPCGYRVAALDISTVAQQFNLAPTGIYRGAGRPEANCLMERLVDKAARARALDPVEIRRRNLLTTTDLPHETGTGNILDSGDYACALDILCDKAGYADLLADRDRRRTAGELVGIGLGFYVEPSGSGWESATVTLNGNGRVTVSSGSSSQGHGRETAYAQIAADTLDIELDAVEVRLADTAVTPEGIGALASRSTAIGGSAVLEACREIAARREAGAPFPITAQNRYANTGQAWGYGAYLALMSIDRETGAPNLERMTCVDDTGRLLNPMLVEGQILGGIAQGLGEALTERVVYDGDGQLLTGSFMDYAMPRAADMPPVDIYKFETPSPMNTLGAKGVGEAGTIGAPAAILNAAIDALSPLGVTDLQMPLTSQMLWHTMQDAGQVE
ncbi:xanthine dehydrogenase family protein molybdopterin-binding subunit [Primorskyibacter sp. S87]|uniref:xanthine dehydrogenase family protein molybdopterin-binding subunit n=1 Tax=Primorskyibacter sp. S87 TaxID=3415126 RepID=UPI003C7EB843